MPKTVGDLSKIIVAKGCKKSPKVQKIAKSGHTDRFIPKYDKDPWYMYLINIHPTAEKNDYLSAYFTT